MLQAAVIYLGEAFKYFWRLNSNLKLVLVRERSFPRNLEENNTLCLLLSIKLCIARRIEIKKQMRINVKMNSPINNLKADSALKM